MIDSALTFAQRGFFFLGIGILAAVICYFLYLPTRKKTAVPEKKKIRERRDPDDIEEAITHPSVGGFCD